VAQERDRRSDERRRSSTWTRRIAALVADALVSGNIVAKGDLERATMIIDEELRVRLSLDDHPPRDISD
jgi:hypothetical protein